MIPRAIPLRDETMFQLAMRHASAAPNVVTDSYERLEFFGDSVLGLVIAQFLYEHHPDWDQGMLSKAKSSVVQERPLAEVALRLGLDEFLELSPSEEATGGRKRPSILADVVEAVIGAIYLESGLEVARWFVLEQLNADIHRISSGDVSPDDYKSKLQETSQQLWRKTPQYRVVRELGSAHERRFVVQVNLDDEVIGEGTGRSKKEAEQAAAEDAISIIESHRRFTQPADRRFE
ncbi:MAG TPA: ribonuclease III [Fimbriimonas sp.]|nr:ribonuclease III [Fimbriimonas sp.]